MRTLKLVALLVGACRGQAPVGTDASPPPPLRAADADAPDAGRQAATAPAQPTKQAVAFYRAALRRGRASAKTGDHAGAVRAFEEALAAVPDDARALSELGWAAFRAGDLAKAEAATRASIARAADVRLEAASLYNLGRIEEERGQKAAAIEAYGRSLGKRPNKKVLERLTKLDPASAASADVFAVRGITGPYASLAAFCDDETHDLMCELDDAGVDEHADVPSPPKPWRAVRFLVGGISPTGTCYLAIQTGAGWFFEDVGACRGTAAYRASLEVSELAIRDVIPGDPPELVARLTEYSSDRVYDDEAEEGIAGVAWLHREVLRVCGIATGDRPLCTPAIVISERSAEPPDEKEHGFKLEVDLRPGAVELKPATGKLEPWVRDTLGVHPLVLPSE